MTAVAAHQKPRKKMKKTVLSNLGRVKCRSNKRVELLDVGEIHEGKKWHNKGYIFPAGFKSSTMYKSSTKVATNVTHICSILEDGDGQPLFRLVSEDRQDEPLDGRSASACWKQALKRINKFYEEKGIKPVKTAIAGPEYFGLNHPDIVSQIENLPNSDVCVKYWEGRAVREVQREQCAKGENYGRKEKTWSTSSERAVVPKVAKPKRAKKAEKAKKEKKRRGKKKARDQDEYDVDNFVTEGTSSWSAVDRGARLKRRRANREGADAEHEEERDEEDCVLPNFTDPITLSPIESPAISPSGFVMGYATWMACLKQGNSCPFTKRPLKKGDIIRLNKHNIENYRHLIKNI